MISFAQLPPEVLQKILFNIDNPKDMLISLETCKSFNGILKSHRFKPWLFPRVIGHLLRYLSYEELHRCRLVCKWWQKSVDNSVRKRLYPKNKVKEVSNTNLPLLRDRFDFGWSYFVYIHASNLSGILKRLNSNQLANPFIWRKLAIFYQYNQHNGFSQDLLRILDTFGDTIRDFVVHIDSITLEAVPYTVCHNILNNCLVRLPNLKRLTIMGARIGEIGDDLVFRYQPLPSLPHLTSLKMGMANSLVMNLIPSYYWKQLEELEVEQRGLETIIEIAGESVATMFPNLKTLNLIGIQLSVSLLCRLHCPLEVLNVFMFRKNADGECEVLTHFGQTLKRFSVCFHSDFEPIR